MSESKTDSRRRYAGIQIRTLEDVQNLINLIIADICESGQAVEYAGRICNLLQVFLKAQEFTQISALESRIATLEQERMQATVGN